MTGRACVLAALLLAAAPATANAATTATLSTVVLTIQGDADPQTVTVTTDGTTLSVTGPVFAGDPDDAGGSCSISGDSTSVSCLESAVLTVSVQGGGGADDITLVRGAEPTYARGEAGDDKLRFTGTDGDQAILQGGDDNDELTVNLAEVTGEGGGGNDTLLAGAGRLSNDPGGQGDDTFVGSPELPDFFFAEPGADTYRGGTRTATGLQDPEDPRLQFTPNGVFGTSIDTVDYEGPDPVTVTLDDAPGDGRAGENDDVGADIEYVIASDGADTVTCGTGSCDLRGGPGADVLTGGPGDDLLMGENDADVISGGAGDDELTDGDSTPGNLPLTPSFADRLDGGAGDDRLLTDRGADDMAGGPGTDFVQLYRYVPEPPASTEEPVPVDFTVTLDDVANDGDTDEGDNVHSDVERFALGPGSDRFTGTAAPQFVEGEYGNDTIDPGGGPDFVDGGFGADTVLAQDGTTDTVRCGEDADTATVDLPGEQPTRADVVAGCETVGGVPFPAVPSPSPQPSPSPGPDRTAPALTLRAAKAKAKAFNRTGALKVAVTCDEACAVAGEIETAQAKLATVGRLSVGSGRLRSGTGRRTLTLKVAKRYRKPLRRKLRARKGLKLVLRVTATDAAGNETTKSATVRVKR